jgi:hypothetical protein
MSHLHAGQPPHPAAAGVLPLLAPGLRRARIDS